jgi:hypothetical protein
MSITANIMAVTVRISFRLKYILQKYKNLLVFGQPEFVF